MLAQIFCHNIFEDENEREKLVSYSFSFKKQSDSLSFFLSIKYHLEYNRCFGRLLINKNHKFLECSSSSDRSLEDADFITCAKLPHPQCYKFLAIKCNQWSRTHSSAITFANLTTIDQKNQFLLTHMVIACFQIRWHTHIKRCSQIT